MVHVDKQVAAFLLSDTGQRLLEAIEAGKQLQFRRRDTVYEEWQDSNKDTPYALDSCTLEYRVKPEPKVRYFIARRDGVVLPRSYEDKPHAAGDLRYYNDRVGEPDYFGPYTLEEYKQVL